jgi:hypothetical protein
MANTIFAAVPIHGMVRHTDTVVEPSAVVANATCKALPLNVELVV